MLTLKERISAELDIDKFIATVRAKAAANPDFIYTEGEYGTGCKYRPDDKNPEGCIMGGTLATLGFILDSSIEDLPIENILKAFKTHTRELKWLSLVQSKQDRGLTWGNAVAEADKEVSFDQE